MNSIFKKFTYIIFFLLIGNVLEAQNNSQINTELNIKYSESIKTFKGKLNKKKYAELKANIENELNSKIPDNKSILINYSQKTQNCISMRFNQEEVLKIIDKQINLSSEICRDNNTVDFFVFSDNSFHNDLYKNNKKFKMDTGFFYNNIFNLHENCGAFLILKPNGKFMKYYGEDYYSQAIEFLEKK